VRRIRTGKHGAQMFQMMIMMMIMTTPLQMS